MTKVHVLCGGRSDERDVSLRSGKAVAEGLKQVGYEVAVYDIDVSDEILKECDVVFPALHGEGGEDGEIQQRLESLGLRYVGSDSSTSKLCMDKATYRMRMLASDLTMADGAVVTRNTYESHPLTSKPHVLKPVNGGSTIDTYINRDVTPETIAKALSSFERHEMMLLESLITGTEITVGILGNEALPIIEIIPPKDQEFDYANKYNGLTQELCPPENVSAALQKQAQEIAMQVHQLSGCRDLSRNDFIISDNNVLYLLETNTMPGMTATSLYPKMANTAGMSFATLADRLIKYALSR